MIKRLSEIKNLKQKTKLIIILAIEFIAIIAVIALIFFAGKKTHTVTFDLNGGILLSGEIEQRVTQGQNATPPSVAKYGHYLRGWSGSYRSVTQDVTVKAIWEYETTPGIEYYFPEHTNYCEISGSFSEIQGEVYIGAYYNDRQVLGIQAGAFKDRTGITSVHLLDGILAIEDEAFMGCTNLEVIEIPSTVVRIGENAFKNCENLKEIILPESLHTIENGAFENCLSLEKITISEGLRQIGNNAFKNCGAMTELSLPDSLEIIGSSAFLDCKSIAKLDLGEGVKTIGYFAFSGCAAVGEVVIPTTVEMIGAGVFDTPNMIIKLYCSEDAVPSGFVLGWHTEGIKLEYNYIPPQDELDDVEGDETDGEKDEDGFWGGIL